MNDIDLIFEAWRRVNEQSRVLRSPAYAQEYGGDGDFPTTPVGNALPYGYVYGNTPQQSDAFIRGVLQKLKAGPNPVLRRIQPVTKSGKTYSYYYDGTPEAFKERITRAIEAQLDQEGRTANSTNIGYGTRVFMNKVLQKLLIPGVGGERVTYVDGDNVPEPEEVAVEENPPGELEPGLEPEPEPEPVPEPEPEPELEPEPEVQQFRLSDTYQIVSDTEVRIPPDLFQSYLQLINAIGRNMESTGSDIVNKLRELTGSYTDAKNIAERMLERGLIERQDVDIDDLPDDFDPFSDIEDDDIDIDIDDLLTDIERDQAGGRTIPQGGLNDF